MPTVLIAGANGLIGRHVTAAFAATPGWRVVTAGRRTFDGDDARVLDQHLTVDLLDPTATVEALTRRPDITHVVFAAYQDRATAQDRTAVNVSMLANTLAGLRQTGSLLQHVTLFQGGKVYGADLGPYKIPACEDDPRIPVPNFYDDQADHLAEAASADGFHWTVLRPDAVVGYAVGNPMNLLMVLAAYASVCRAQGLPLRFPGTDEQYRALFQVTDAELLGRAAVWAATDQAATDEVFNVTNGDAFRWCDLFPRIAKAFGVGLAPPVPFSMVDAMTGNTDVWQWLVDQYELRSTPWDEVAAWAFGDVVFHAGFDQLFSTVKIRQAGFTDAYDSRERFCVWFHRLAAMRVIPPSTGRELAT